MNTIFPSRFAWILAPAILLLAGCGDHRDSQARLEQANKLAQAGDHSAAIIELKNAVENAPQDKKVRLQLGELYNAAEQYPFAEKELRKALELGADRNVVVPGLQTALLGQGEYKRLLDEKLEWQGASVEVRARLAVGHGLAQIGLNRLVEAEASLDDAERLAAGLEETYLGRAMLQARSGNIQNALKEVDRALGKNPGSKQALILKGDLLASAGQPDQSRAAYARAAAVAPSSLQAQLRLASLALEQGKIEEARAAIGKASRLAPGSLLVRYTQALLEFRAGKAEQAQNHISEVLKASPDYLPANLLAGTLAYGRRDLQLAQSLLSKVVNGAPANLPARKLLAATELKLGNLPRAEEVLKPVLAGKLVDSAVLGLIGEIRMKAGDYAGASHYLEQAAKLAPKNAAIRTDLAVSRLAQGDSALALADLEAAAGFDEKFIQADSTLVLALLRQRENDKALAAITAMDKKFPDSPMVHSLRAAAYIGKQDKPNARKSYERLLAVQPDFFPAAANLAQMDMDEKNSPAAKRRIQAFLDKNRGHVTAMLAMADIARRESSEKEYLVWLEKAANADAKSAAPRIQLARYWLTKNNPGKALGYAREAVSVQPGNTLVLGLLGQTQLASGDAANGLATYKKVVDMAPSASAYLNLAMAQMISKEPQQAARSLEQALKLEPSHPDALASLATIELGNKRYDRTLQLAGQLQKAHPKLEGGYLLEGDARLAMGQTATALALYEASYRRNPNSALAIKLHNMLVSGGNAAQGEVLMRQWLKDNPRDVAARLHLAQVQTQSGNTAGAIAQYEFLLQQVPNQVVALNNLAGLYHQTRDSRALKTAEAAHKLLPQHPGVLDTLGWILVGQGQTARGLGYLREALTKMPDQPEIHWHLAYGLYKSGDRARARQELKRLLDGGLSFPQQVEARALLAQLEG